MKILNKNFYKNRCFLNIMKWKNSILWGNSLFESLSNIEKDLKQYFGLFMFVIIRKIFKSGLYSSQDSIKMSHLWTRTIFELGLYSSQASINDSTVYKRLVFCNFHIQHNLAQNSEMCQKLPILMVNKMVKNWTTPKPTPKWSNWLIYALEKLELWTQKVSYL